MYSRFTPGPNGTYQRQQVQSAPRQTAPPPPPPPPVPPPPKAELQPQGIKALLSRLLPKGLELGDVLVLLIALLLIIDGEEDLQTVLITAAAFFLL